MTEDELKEVNQVKEAGRIHLALLTNQSNRTLLWGYTCDRADWHVYIRFGDIHLLTKGGYHNVNIYLCQDNFKPEELVPDKRLYPEACDFEFCKLLKTMGVYLPFTVYDPSRKPAQYHGPIF